MFRDAANGWTQRTFTSPADFRLPYQRDHAALARRIREALLGGPGFTVVTGTPVASLGTADAQRFSEAMLRHLGEPLPQGHGTDTALAWLVRDEGVSAHTDDRRFHENAYTSKSRGYLHPHNDQAVRPFGQDPDWIALLTHRRAAQGGASVLVDGWTVHHVLREEFPGELSLLSTPFAFDRRHVTPPGKPSVVRAPVFDVRADGRVHVRCNAKRLETAAELTGKPLSPARRTAVDALKQVVARPELGLTILLEEGDCLITDDRRILHGRTAYEDHSDVTRRRCLIRVMLRRHGLVNKEFRAGEKRR
ncbi:TauD/TfdA family dioxygenase [Streptomyces sp. HU2014]|uniref:TauD/TfdA family dioxygenase n=1 Tax=Streptomyces sp. HU2014 TaxID=2939414 RepID=UPI00200BF800|nr:TauD/TfdA family dioxygenase [Streptomyces sp. HU2014]UQI45176.1 TauD/TfdA family dioxygenase [Streptomyces sp. HU2014]